MSTSGQLAVANSHDIIITHALRQRAERAPKLHAEVAAFCELSQILTDDAPDPVRRFLEITRLLCSAGTAGLSLYEDTAGLPRSFRWAAISGALAAFEGREMLLDSSPYALCLDAGAPILVERPERVCTQLHAIRPPIVESLLVPLYDTAKRPLGVLWLAHHATTPGFCVNDVRVLEQLAVQLVLALKLEKTAQEHRHALGLLDAQQTTRLELENERLRREQAEASAKSVRDTLAMKDAVLMEADHRVKNTLQIAAAALSLQAHATRLPEVRIALQEAGARLHLLARVHEMLYRNHEAREIAMGQLLFTMGDALRGSFAEASPNVVLRIVCDPITLSADDAVPMALLANEAMTNAYKYAFPDGSAGQINVSFTHDTDDVLILRIADDGVGMHGNGSDDGLGLKLIRIFAAQLKGILSIDTARAGAGTALTLSVHRARQTARSAMTTTTTARRATTSRARRDSARV
jgi:two-component sensor histidine kinase